jgi:TRAP-type uncharacterized transport system substrate-binding protein
MRKIISLLLVACFILIAGCSGASSAAPSSSAAPASSAAPSSSAPAQKETVYLECGGASNTSFIYSVLVAFSEVLNGDDSWVKMNVQATAGSTAHYQMFTYKLIQIGSGSAFADYGAWTGGSKSFPNPLHDFRNLIITSANFQTSLSGLTAASTA